MTFDDVTRCAPSLQQQPSLRTLLFLNNRNQNKAVFEALIKTIEITLTIVIDVTYYSNRLLLITFPPPPYRLLPFIDSKNNRVNTACGNEGF